MRRRGQRSNPHSHRWAHSTCCPPRRWDSSSDAGWALLSRSHYPGFSPTLSQPLLIGPDQPLRRRGQRSNLAFSPVGPQHLLSNTPLGQQLRSWLGESHNPGSRPTLSQPLLRHPDQPLRRRGQRSNPAFSLVGPQHLLSNTPLGQQFRSWLGPAEPVTPPRNRAGSRPTLSQAFSPGGPQHLLSNTPLSLTRRHSSPLVKGTTFTASSSCSSPPIRADVWDAPKGEACADASASSQPY